MNIYEQAIEAMTLWNSGNGNGHEAGCQPRVLDAPASPRASTPTTAIPRSSLVGACRSWQHRDGVRDAAVKVTVEPVEVIVGPARAWVGGANLGAGEPGVSNGGEAAHLPGGVGGQEPRKTSCLLIPMGI